MNDVARHERQTTKTGTCLASDHTTLTQNITTGLSDRCPSRNSSVSPADRSVGRDPDSVHRGSRVTAFSTHNGRISRVTSDLWTTLIASYVV